MWKVGPQLGAILYAEYVSLQIHTLLGDMDDIGPVLY